MCEKLKKQEESGTTDYPLLDYFRRPVLREKFLVGILMILVRHWCGYVIYVAYLWYALNHFYSVEEARTFNYITVGSDILVVTLSSLIFSYFKRVKWFWIFGCAGTSALVLACGLLIHFEI